LSIQSVKRIIQDSDGYQPFLVAPENGYRALVREGVKLMEQPASMAVDAVDMVLRDIGQKVWSVAFVAISLVFPHSNCVLQWSCVARQEHGLLLLLYSDLNEKFTVCRSFNQMR